MVQKWDKIYLVFVKIAKHLTEEKWGEKRFKNLVILGHFVIFHYSFSNWSEITDKKVTILKYFNYTFHHLRNIPTFPSFT